MKSYCPKFIFEGVNTRILKEGDRYLCTDPVNLRIHNCTKHVLHIFIIVYKVLFKILHLNIFCYFQELTGHLPPETPLAPGEQPPQIRRRVGTSFSLDTNFVKADQEVGIVFMSKIFNFFY